MAHLTKKQYQENELSNSQRREQEQLIGYWAKTKGFSKAQIDKSTTDVNLLQAIRLATNIIKNIKGEHKEVYRDCNDLIARHRKGSHLSEKQINLIFRHSKRIQRQQAKIARKATR